MTATEVPVPPRVIDVDESTEGVVIAGAEIERWWNYIGAALGVGVIHQTGTYGDTTMLPFTLLGRLRFPMLRCERDPFACVSLTFSAGPLLWFGWVLDSGAAGVGFDGRAGVEAQLSRHFGSFVELRALTGSAGTSDRHVEITSGALLVGLTIR